MNALGMTRDACHAALERYLGQVRQLIATVGHAKQQALGEHGDVLFESLRFEIEVDLTSRDGAAIHQRLSEIELTVFAPALRKIQAHAERLALSRASAQWLPELRMVEGVIRDALDLTVHWAPD